MEPLQSGTLGDMEDLRNAPFTHDSWTSFGPWSSNVLQYDFAQSWLSFHASIEELSRWLLVKKLDTQNSKQSCQVDSCFYSIALEFLELGGKLPWKRNCNARSWIRTISEPSCVGPFELKRAKQKSTMLKGFWTTRLLTTHVWTLTVFNESVHVKPRHEFLHELAHPIIQRVEVLLWMNMK